MRQALIIRDGPQRRTKVRDTNRRAVPVRRLVLCNPDGVHVHDGSALQAPAGHTGDTPAGEDAPGHTTIYRRHQSTCVRRDSNAFTVDGRRMRRVAPAVDSTGLKRYYRGERTRRKRKVRRGLAKLHILADTDTKRILP